MTSGFFARGSKEWIGGKEVNRQAPAPLVLRGSSSVLTSCLRLAEENTCERC